MKVSSDVQFVQQADCFFECEAPCETTLVGRVYPENTEERDWTRDSFEYRLARM
jgi:hypothetical protein